MIDLSSTVNSKRSSLEKKSTSIPKSIITATAVRQLVRQKLCLLQLKRRKMLPKSTIVNMRLQTLETELARRKETLDDFLATKQISEEKLRESFEWEIGVEEIW